MTKEVSMLGKLIIKDGKTGLAAPLVSKLSDDVKTQGNAVRYEYFIAGNEVHLLKLTQTVMAGSAMWTVSWKTTLMNS